MNAEFELMNFTENLPKSWQAKFVYKEDRNYDGTLSLWLGPKHHRLKVEFKRIHRKETLRNLRIDDQYVLVTNALTEFLRTECDTLGINYIDEAGNIRIINDDMYVLVTTPNSNSGITKQPVVMTEGIVKCVFALICEPSLLKSTYEKIASKAGISVSMANKAINFLVQNKHIPKDKTKRRFFDTSRLMYDWITSYYKHIGSKQISIPYPPPADWRSIVLPDNAVWGGEAAAAELTDYLHPEHLLLYAHQQVPKYETNKADANAPRLNVCKPFWGVDLQVTDTGRALLTIAELIATKDGRNREVAEIINDRFLQIKTLPQ
ncbi:type IV toxin-antitoxin system AbiEi family antitoxin [Vibrio sp. 1159]|uniref:type IV toxin-antitoxin system AbiEi family antitoxin n=1 Tax=Vibrio sp. 1159 TaxID=3074545 RepID=UPI002963D1CD|nr:type IV toxin-antitoxin system AbiEi family antitoxin [Vibrio sp. 1159]MDW2322701.1 type IV toxin-antitoxin system AbiEi family antitoxin [Vibrio sp. 1159]